MIYFSIYLLIVRTFLLSVLNACLQIKICSTWIWQVRRRGGGGRGACILGGCSHHPPEDQQALGGIRRRRGVDVERHFLQNVRNQYSIIKTSLYLNFDFFYCNRKIKKTKIYFHCLKMHFRKECRVQINRIVTPEQLEQVINQVILLIPKSFWNFSKLSMMKNSGRK